MSPTKPSHGAYQLKSKLEQGKLDLRSSAGQAMKRLREAFHADLGGDLSTAQKALVDRAITKIMIAELVEAWTLKQTSIISTSGELPPVLKQNYLSWSAELRRDLLALGLQRRPKDVKDLGSLLSEAANDTEAEDER